MPQVPDLTALVPAGGGVLDDEALEQAYAPPRPRWVRCGFAATVDGAIEISGRSGDIGGPADRRVFAALRALADVVVAGSATVAAEGYGQVRLDGPAATRRAARGQRPEVPVAVVTTRGRLAPGLRLWREAAEGGPRPVVLTSSAASPGDRAALARVADVVVCGDAEVDPAAAIAAMADRGWTRVLCEGGPGVAGRWLAAGVVDELCLTTGPLLAGPGHPSLAGGPAWAAPVHVSLAGLVAGGGALFARYHTAPAAGAPG